jgi:hypothetical protein
MLMNRFFLGARRRVLSNSCQRTAVRGAWLASVAALIVVSTALAQQSQPAPPASSTKNSAQPAGAATTRARYHAGVPKRAVQYYGMVWGVDSLDVKWTESGEVVRFSYRVLDPAKAAMLNDKKYEPSLIDPQAGVSLVVPSLEKVGKLRQSSAPESGKTYWMAFSNKGRHVKKGDRVNVVIGNFRAEGLVVN